MTTSINADTWVWVVVQDPDGNEQFLGQLDAEQNISFIPAFYQKEDAQQCLTQMHRQKGKKYEIQAILFDELAKDAAKHEFMIFMLNSEGEILEKIQP
ncbi:MAG: hypothetical protein PVF56_13090 [Desulfobacterales bacterium]